jgi:hypothetical protein
VENPGQSRGRKCDGHMISLRCGPCIRIQFLLQVAICCTTSRNPHISCLRPGLTQQATTLYHHFTAAAGRIAFIAGSMSAHVEQASWAAATGPYISSSTNWPRVLDAGTCHDNDDLGLSCHPFLEACRPQHAAQALGL